MLSLTNVSKEYDDIPVLQWVNWRVRPGCRYILCAPNGSGKTTLLKIMAGLIRPTHGDVEWDGQPFHAADRSHLGVVLEKPLVYGDLTGFENLLFHARLHGVRDAAKQVKFWLTRAGLTDVASQKVRAYSKGMLKRLSIARAMIHKPDVLLLDEPFDGLDTWFRSEANDWFTEAREAGAAVVMVTHQPEAPGLEPYTRLTLSQGCLKVLE